MGHRLATPDYRLAWPRALFVSEAANLLNYRDRANWNDRCELLIEQAFAGKSEDFGPLASFRELKEEGFGTSYTLTNKQSFLRDLMNIAGQLQEGAQRRPYWRERKAAAQDDHKVTRSALVREYIALFAELDGDGYFDQQFGKDCVDDWRDYEFINSKIHRELGLDSLLPLKHNELTDDIDLFFDVVEFFHDQTSRPTARSLHNYADCGWHYHGYDTASGQALYRWRVNRLIEYTEFGLCLAGEGDDIGRLVAENDEAREQLVKDVAERSDRQADDQVRHALALYRSRGAGRNEKRSAVAALALVLEERRRNVLTDAMSKSDRGALFDIANNFHVRHQDAKQKRDYDEYYLDWIFWIYLASVELTSKVLDDQES